MRSNLRVSFAKEQIKSSSIYLLSSVSQRQKRYSAEGKKCFFFSLFVVVLINLCYLVVEPT